MSDYRKRAEEFISGWDVWDFPGEGEKLVKMLEQAFFEVAQEARREENEACKHEVDVFKDSLGLHLHSRITSRIRLRLEGK